MPSVTEKHRSSVLNDATWFASSLYLAKFLGLPCSIITARLLGPFLFGTWRALRLILNYASLLQLGIFDGLTREIPYLRGKGKTEEVLAYKQTAFTVSVLVASGGAIILFVASWILERQYSPMLINGIRVMAAVVFFRHIYGFYDYFLRAEQNFILVSRAKILYAAAGSILQVIGVLVYGINGLFFSLILVNIGIVVYMFRKMPIGFGIFHFQIIFRLMRNGFPMLLNGMADILLHTVDRLMIVAFLGRKELGYYAVALLAASLVDFIPAAAQSVLLPRIMRKPSASRSFEELNMFWLEPLYILAYVLPILAGLGCLLAPVVIRLLLPTYLSGVPALKILAIGTCFAAVVTMTRNLFVAVNKQYRVLGAFLVTTVVGYGLNYIFLTFGLGITGVALATSLAFLLLGLLLLYMAFSLKHKKNKLPGVLTRIYGPILAIVGILICLEIFVPPAADFRGEVYHTTIKLGIYLVLILPLLFAFNQKSGLISQFFLKVKEILT